MRRRLERGWLLLMGWYSIRRSWTCWASEVSCDVCWTRRMNGEGDGAELLSPLALPRRQTIGYASSNPKCKSFTIPS